VRLFKMHEAAPSGPRPPLSVSGPNATSRDHSARGPLGARTSPPPCATLLESYLHPRWRQELGPQKPAEKFAAEIARTVGSNGDAGGTPPGHALLQDTLPSEHAARPRDGGGHCCRRRTASRGARPREQGSGREQSPRVNERLSKSIVDGKLPRQCHDRHPWDPQPQGPVAAAAAAAAWSSTAAAQSPRIAASARS
jgi:hypothetical protein